jgi:hypothetical protein
MFKPLFQIKHLGDDEKIFDKENIFGYTVSPYLDENKKISKFFLVSKYKIFEKENYEEWREVKTEGKPPSTRIFQTSFIYNHFLYVFGGIDKTVQFNDGYKLDLGKL